MNPIWTACSKSKLNEIQRIQNKIVKNVQNKPIRTSTESLYTDLPNIATYSYIQIVQTINKIEFKKLKSDMILNQIGSTNNYFLRNLINFRPLFFKSEKCKKSLASRGLTLYNKLPNEIKEIEQCDKFKTKTKKHVIANEIQM